MPTNSLDDQTLLIIRQALVDDLVRRGRYRSNQYDYLQKLEDRNWAEDNEIEMAAMAEEIDWQSRQMHNLEIAIDKVNELLGVAR